MKRQINKVLKLIKPEVFNTGDLDQRGIASMIENHIQSRFKSSKLFEYVEPESVRSIDDFTLKHEDHTYLIDVKTHDDDRSFSMPNLISVERLYRLYESNPHTSFCLLIVKYQKFSNNQKYVKDIKFMPIEQISWESLSIQNLGNGQIQITNLNKPIQKFNGSRQQWMAEFTLQTVKFNEKLKHKLEQRTHKWIKRSGETLMNACS